MKKFLSILMLTAFGLGAIPMTTTASYAKSSVPSRTAKVHRHKVSKVAFRAKKGRKARVRRGGKKPVSTVQNPATSE